MLRILQGHIYKVGKEEEASCRDMGKETLQSFQSDFNPFAMRTELSFNLPNAVLGETKCYTRGERNSPVGNECFLTRNPTVRSSN